VAIVVDSVTSFHQHCTELEHFLCKGAGTVFFCGDSVWEGEGMESHMVVYTPGLFRCGTFYKKYVKKVVYFLRSFFLKKIMLLHLLKRGDQIIYAFEDLKEAVLKAMAEGLCILRLRVNKDGTTQQMVIYEPSCLNETDLNAP